MATHDFDVLIVGSGLAVDDSRDHPAPAAPVAPTVLLPPTA